MGPKAAGHHLRRSVQKQGRRSGKEAPPSPLHVRGLEAHWGGQEGRQTPPDPFKDRV